MKKILFLFAFAIGMMAFAGEPVKTETTIQNFNESSYSLMKEHTTYTTSKMEDNEDAKFTCLCEINLGNGEYYTYTATSTVSMRDACEKAFKGAMQQLIGLK